MKTLFVTAGDQWEYPSLAARSVTWINHLADMFGSVRAIDLSKDIPWADAKAPQFGKAWIWDFVPDDVERIIWVDCDAIVIRPVQEEMVPKCVFGATYDQGYTDDIIARTPELQGFTVATCFNSGVMVAHRDARCIFEELKQYAGDKANKQLDQIWLNVIVKAKLGGWTEIGSAWNTLVGHCPVEGAHILHFAGHNWRGALTGAMYETVWSVMSLGG